MASRRHTPDETITNLCEAEVELAQGRSPAPERGRSCSTEGLGIQLRPTYRKHMRVYDRGPEPALRSYERRSMPRAANLVRASRASWRIIELEHPVATFMRDWTLRSLPDSLLLRQSRMALQYDFG